MDPPTNGSGMLSNLRNQFQNTNQFVFLEHNYLQV